MNEKQVLQDDLQILKDAILNSPKNIIFAYLNLNSLHNDFNDLRILLQDISLRYIVLSKTKLGSSFPAAQFHIPGYEIRARRDRNKYGGGLIECVKKGVISKKIQKFETLIHKSICSELTIAKKKWLCFSIYRSPTLKNSASFFEELTDCLSKGSYSFFVLGDSNIDV